MKHAVLGAVSLFLIGGIFQGWAFADEKAGASAEATADIRDAKGREVGSATFRETDKGVAVTINVKGLPPGEHGTHIHEVGKCDPPDFKSAGGHFNPAKKEHGLKNPKGPHMGDMPNLVVDRDGTGKLETVLEGVMLKRNMPKSLFHPKGTAVVIHADPDDQMTDPAGESGDRIACGVIRKE
jgi:superoxide dismutase, Cu-Zn family